VAATTCEPKSPSPCEECKHRTTHQEEPAHHPDRLSIKKFCPTAVSSGSQGDYLAGRIVGEWTSGRPGTVTAFCGTPPDLSLVDLEVGFDRVRPAC